jgi:hypothetical protein
MTKHAVLSASGSERWLACPPSARLEQEFESNTSIYAEEGRFAHHLAELYLRHYLGVITKEQLNARIEELKKNEFYSQEMEDHVQTYVDIAAEKINAARAKSKDAIVFLEQRLDFSYWVPEGFGTGDLVLVADGVVEVVDLKYGKGVPVSAIGNTQMRLYGLGAFWYYDMLYDIDVVRMTIVQPRLDSISTEELSAAELLKWGNKTVRPIAKLAFDGKGEFVAGEHCRFCKARYTCRARAEANLELAKYEFQDPPLLEQEEIADVLGRATELRSWVADVLDYALVQARDHGAHWPGWKLVEGRSNRKYTDEDAVADTLKGEGYKDKDIYEEVLKGITKMEKLLGKKKFTELLTDAELVIKPPGKPTLVPESDKRPEIDPLASAKKDFEKGED